MVLPSGDCELAVHRAEHTDGQGLIETEGVSDRHHLLADDQSRGTSEGERLELAFRSVDDQDGEVLVGSQTDQAALVLGPVGRVTVKASAP